jgi:prepilin-type processing-associated H-X9-DG protein
LISILLPSLNRARETANRIKCASNMRQIGQALLQYSDTNHGQYPHRLEDLFLAESMTPNIFICPSSNDTAATGATPQAQAAALAAGGHESYIYVPDLSSTASGQAVVLYEPLENHSRDGINVLFLDGRVQFLTRPLAIRMMSELQAGRNPPQIGQ